MGCHSSAVVPPPACSSSTEDEEHQEGPGEYYYDRVTLMTTSYTTVAVLEDSIRLVFTYPRCTASGDRSSSSAAGVLLLVLSS